MFEENKKPLGNDDLFLLRSRLKRPGAERPGLTQGQMAELLGISTGMYCLYERGKAPIKSTVQKLARMMIKQLDDDAARAHLRDMEDINLPGS